MNNFSEYLRLHIVLPIAEKIKHTCATKWLKQITQMQTWSREEIKRWQEQHLQAFIKHAYEHTKYYRNLFDSIGLKPEDIQVPEDLKKLPILTKEDVRKHYQELIPDNISSIYFRYDQTGGTTGEPMRYLTCEDVWGYITASKIFAWRTMGYKYGDKFVALGSSSLFGRKPSLTRHIYDKIRNEIGMNSLNMSEEICSEYLNRMQKEHIQWIYGYASSVYLLAKYAKKNHVDVSFVKGAFTTSENLTDVYRQTIEDTFHCRVMDCYGSRDAGITAFEIERGKYYVSYDVIPEIIDEFGDGEGTLLSTCVLNWAFPLIRYNFGDCAKLKLDDTTYNGAVIEKIYGRTSDVLRLDNGHVLTSPGFTILMRDFDVVAYDIQKISGSKIKMQVQPIVERWTDEQAIKLCAEMQHFIGEGCEFSLEIVDHFEPLKNGKHRYFMNDISE